MSTEKNNKTENEARAALELNNLGLNLDDLKNKITLDVGAGAGSIAKVAEEKGIKVISLDKNPEMWIEEEYNLPTLYIKSSAESLPFKDETFDLIISHAGQLTIAPTKELVTQILKEAYRVLKKSGEIRFGPGFLNANIFNSEELFMHNEEQLFTTEQRMQRITEKSLEFLKSINQSISAQPIENPRNSVVKTYYLLKK